MAMRASVLLAALLLAGSAAAHHATPPEVVARLNGTEMRTEYGIASAAIATDLPRMLVVRVGPTWFQVDAVRRVTAAESWYALWRDAVPGGVLAVVDAAEQPVVNFDSAGRARLHDPAAARPTAAPPPR
jgi:hypothetical protein